MPQKAWSAKRKRQYTHVKESLLEGGKPTAVAAEIASRVVNKERAQHGESVTASGSTINDMSAGRRVGVVACAPTKVRVVAQYCSFAMRPVSSI